MTTDETTTKSYLNELCQQTGGDIEKQASMYDIGMVIGLEKSVAGSLAEELMVQGLVELKTLSGGIGITSEGLAVLGISVTASPANLDQRRLSDNPVTTDADREVIQVITSEIQNTISSKQLEYALLEEIVLDFKTLEVQMLSPNPKNAILREVFRSLRKSCETAKLNDIATTLRDFSD